MYLWEVTMRTLDEAGATGTQTFFVHAATDEQAQLAARKAARGPRQTAHRRGATISEVDITVAWKCAAFGVPAPLTD
jgi:hypothetical protein